MSEINEQLRANERQRKALRDEANSTWQRLLVATNGNRDPETLANLDIPRARALFEEWARQVQAARELRTEYERLKAEV